MLLKETLTVLKRKSVVRALSPTVPLLPGTNRTPRYRVRIPQNAQDLLVGTTLSNNFYVLSVLGYGGMSVVYKAKRLKKPRIVAVKTLRLQSLSDERTVKRFEREAELLSHLNHPRIVQVFDSGTTRRGQPFFVMDYLMGENLSTVFKELGPMPAARVRDIFTQVCGAVDHAHRCGVVHRDLKPGNIMLTEEEEKKDSVKVVDFGIARFEQESQRLTRMGEVWGSPIYMSPEQCMGAQLDTRSDIYSLGVVMYEAITARVPFLGKNYVETMTLQIMAFPKPFSEMCPGKTFLPALEKVVRKALEKEPDKRYQTMSELRADLELAVPRAKKHGLNDSANTLQDFPEFKEPSFDKNSKKPIKQTLQNLVKNTFDGGIGSSQSIRPQHSSRNDMTAFEGDIPGGRISKSKNAVSRNNMPPVRKPAQGVSGTRIPSTASPNSSSEKKFWPRVSRIFLIAAFGLMALALVALTVQFLSSAIPRHKEVNQPTSTVPMVPIAPLIPHRNGQP